MIQGIHHVSMKCSNAEEYAAVRAFYTELLRIPVLTEWETGILLDTGAGITGAGIVEIFQYETAEKLGQGVIRHFAFAVKDVEACVAAVRAGGYPILIEPKTVAIGGNAAFSAKIAFCKGALGEEIEFFQQMWQ